MNDQREETSSVSSSNEANLESQEFPSSAQEVGDALDIVNADSLGDQAASASREFTSLADEVGYALSRMELDVPRSEEAQEFPSLADEVGYALSRMELDVPRSVEAELRNNVGDTSGRFQNSEQAAASEYYRTFINTLEHQNPQGVLGLAENSNIINNNLGSNQNQDQIRSFIENNGASLPNRPDIQQGNIFTRAWQALRGSRRNQGALPQGEVNEQTLAREGGVNGAIILTDPQVGMAFLITLNEGQVPRQGSARTNNRRQQSQNQLRRHGGPRPSL